MVQLYLIERQYPCSCQTIISVIEGKCNISAATKAISMSETLTHYKKTFNLVADMDKMNTVGEVNIRQKTNSICFQKSAVFCWIVEKLKSCKVENQ